MSFFSNLTKFIVSPITLTADVLTAGQLEATKTAFEGIDEAYSARPIVRPVIRNVVERAHVDRSVHGSAQEKQQSMEERFEALRASNNLNNDHIIAEKHWGDGTITRWSATRVYTYYSQGLWVWTYRNPPKDAIVPQAVLERLGTDE